jgi:uncharacterized integral membrane protein (TIGR00698 family)
MSAASRLAAGRLAAAPFVRGLLLAGLVATSARFLSDHYGAPVMLFALLLGIAFNFLGTDPRFQPGIEFASRILLRIGVALLGFRLSLGDVAALGVVSVLSLMGLVAATIGFGILLAPLLGRRWRFGLLTGGAVAICGASAALAIAAVLPRRDDLERDTLFTVVAVTTLSTIAMILYPVLFRALGLDEAQSGFLIGATIHDVAQVVGAGYSIGERAGDLATLVKLGRVMLLPAVLLAIILSLRATGVAASGRIGLPAFVVAFVAIVLFDCTGLVPMAVRDAASVISQWLLVIAIAALGVKTSLKAMLDLGPRHILLVVGETLFLLLAALSVDLLVA